MSADSPPPLRIVRPEAPPPAPRSVAWPALAVACVIAVAAIVMYQSSKPADDAVGWIDDYDAAASLAASDGRMILLDFTADWCPPCRMMKQDVFSVAEVGEAVRAAFVPVRMDLTRNTGKPAELADYFNIEAFPTLVALDSAGREVGRQVGALPRDRFLLWLAEMQQREKAEARNPKSE